MWRVKLVAEAQPGVTTETGVARIERDEDAGLAGLGLRLEVAAPLSELLPMSGTQHASTVRKALVARPLAGVPAQTYGSLSLGAAQTAA